MRTRLSSLLIASLACLALPSATQAQSSNSADQAAGRAVVMKVDQGFRNGNAKQIASVYSDDADWINAFGVELKGREQIQ